MSEQEVIDIPMIDVDKIAEQSDSHENEDACETVEEQPVRGPPNLNNIAREILDLIIEEMKLPKDILNLADTCRSLRRQITSDQLLWYVWLEASEQSIADDDYQDGINYYDHASKILRNIGEPIGCCMCLSDHRLKSVYLGNIYYKALCFDHYMLEFESLYYAKARFPKLFLAESVEDNGKIPSTILKSLVAKDLGPYEIVTTKTVMNRAKRSHKASSQAECQIYLSSFCDQFADFWNNDPKFSRFHMFFPHGDIRRWIHHHATTHISRWGGTQHMDLMAKWILKACEKARDSTTNRPDITDLEIAAAYDDLRTDALNLLKQMTTKCNALGNYCNCIDHRYEIFEHHLGEWMRQWFARKFPGCFSEEALLVEDACQFSSHEISETAPHWLLGFHVFECHYEDFLNTTVWTWTKDGVVKTFHI